MCSLKVRAIHIAMNSTGQKSLDDILCCDICTEPYDEKLHRPLMLPACGHTFCRSCIEVGRFKSCPMDRSPVGDIFSLPTNILVLRSLQGPVDSRSKDSQMLGISGDVKFIRSEEIALEQKVGEGGSGTVWKAMYKRKTVAVKMFSIDLAAGSTQGSTTATSSRSSGSNGGSTGSSDPLMNAFMREVELLSLVSEDSMYCCRLVGCSVMEGRPCIVMKWFGNGHLQVPIGGYDLANALQWGTAIAKALADVHALGIIVADLKPENVLLSDQGDPVLADFGISRRVASTINTLIAGRAALSATTQSIKGTPYYMAPEQWQAGKLTNRVDIWAWGCLMIQLLTGQPPWIGLNMYQVLNAVAMQGASPQLPPNLPEGLTNLLSCCFKHQPATRPSAAQLVYELRDFSSLWIALSLDSGSVPSTPGPERPLPTYSVPSGQGVATSYTLGQAGEKTDQAVLERLRQMYLDGA